MLKNYELTVVFKEPTSQIEETDLIESLKAQLITAGATTISEQILGIRGLAYPIKKQKSGLYYTTIISLDTSKIANLEQEIRRSASILRHLAVEELRFSEYQLTAQSQKDEQENIDEDSSIPTEEDRSVLDDLPPSVATSKKSLPNVEEVTTEDEPVDEVERQEKLNKKLEELLKE